MISKSFIDSLLARASIVDVIQSEGLQLKKAGKNYTACCPFHDEKTPSFAVNEERQSYHCFGCGADGDAIKFVQEYRRITFPEAVKVIADKYNMDVVHEVSANSNFKKPQSSSDVRKTLISKINGYFIANRKQAEVPDYLRLNLSEKAANDLNLGMMDLPHSFLLDVVKNKSTLKAYEDLGLDNQKLDSDAFTLTTTLPIVEDGQLSGIVVCGQDEDFLIRADKLKKSYIRLDETPTNEFFVFLRAQDVLFANESKMTGAVASLPGTHNLLKTIRSLSGKNTNVTVVYNPDDPLQSESIQRLASEQYMNKHGVTPRYLALNSSLKLPTIIARNNKAFTNRILDTSVYGVDIVAAYVIKECNSSDDPNAAAKNFCLRMASQLEDNIHTRYILLDLMQKIVTRSRIRIPLEEHELHFRKTPIDNSNVFTAQDYFNESGKNVRGVPISVLNTLAAQVVLNISTVMRHDEFVDKLNAMATIPDLKETILGKILLQGQEFDYYSSNKLTETLSPKEKARLEDEMSEWFEKNIGSDKGDAYALYTFIRNIDALLQNGEPKFDNQLEKSKKETSSPEPKHLSTAMTM